MQQLEPYFFAAITRRIEALRAAGVDVIRLDIGAPDMPPADSILASLVDSASQPTSHSYQSYNGSPEFRDAWAQWYAAEWGVELEPDTEVVPLLGSKEGIFHLTQAVVDPHDVVLVPDPGYPSYARAARYAGAEIYAMPLLSENRFRPDLSSIPTEVVQRAKVLWINYPNNPTGGVADRTFFERVVAFAHEHDILVAHDAPYARVTFDGYRPPSALQIDGAVETVVEFNSLSKSHNMAGWRIGVAAGNAEVLQAIYTLKTNIDTGFFLPIMQGAIAALTGDQSWLASRNTIYQRRRDKLVRALRMAGLDASPQQASLYIWTPVPAGMTSAGFTAALLEQAGVSVAPGSAFGEYGEGFVRISVGASDERVAEACDRIARLSFGSWRGVK